MLSTAHLTSSGHRTISSMARLWWDESTHPPFLLQSNWQQVRTVGGTEQVKYRWSPAVKYCVRSPEQGASSNHVLEFSRTKSCTVIPGCITHFISSKMSLLPRLPRSSGSVPCVSVSSGRKTVKGRVYHKFHEAQQRMQENFKEVETTR